MHWSTTNHPLSLFLTFASELNFMSKFNKSSSSKGKGYPRGKKVGGSVRFKKKTDKREDKPAFSERRKPTGGSRGFESSSSDRKPFLSAKPFGKRPEKDSPSGERPFRPRKDDDRPFRSGFKKEGFVKSGDKKFERSSDRPFRPRRDDDRPPARGDKREGFKKTGERKFEKSSDRPFRPRREDDRPFARGDKREGFNKTGERKFEKSSDRPFRPRREDDRPFERRERKEGFDKADDRKFERAGDRPLRARKEVDPSPDITEVNEGAEQTGEKKFERSTERVRRPRKATGEDRPFTRRRDDDKTDRKPFERSEGDRERPYTPRRSDDRPSTSRAPGKGWEKPRSEGGDSDRKWNRKESHEFYGDRKKSSSFGRKKTYKPTAADEGLTRLNKYIANAGICSRREADDLILAGVVSVNGEVITELGYKVKDGDVVKYNKSVLKGERLVYLLLNKPKDFITTTDDPQERKTVMSLIVNACKERVYPVGRLDRNTTGVLLMTNDGDLARKLTHPSFEVQKVYQVELDKALKSSDFQLISEGIKMEDGLVKVDDIAYVGSGDDKSVLGVEIHSGKNRIVRRIFESLDYKVKKLDRVIFAGLTKKDLPRGRWRFLTPMEVANLKMMTGNKKFASAE
jgi:23S rRNA pseudouridine2605 synthase